MTRSRARRPTQEMVLYKGVISPKGTQKILNSFHYTLSSAMLAFAGREQTLHPNYGMANGSIDSKVYGNTVGQTSAIGFHANLIVKRVKLIFQVANAQAIPFQVNILPVPWNLSGGSGLGTDYNYNLANRANVKSFLVNSNTQPNNLKKFVVIFDIETIEGVKDIDNLPQYWATTTTRGTQYTNYYVQVWSLDNSTLVTSGLIMQIQGEFDCVVKQTNVNLNV